MPSLLPHCISRRRLEASPSIVCILMDCAPHVTNLEGNWFCVGDDKGGLGTVDTADRAVDVNLAALVGEIHVTHTILLQACKEAWNGSSLQLCSRKECRKRKMDGEQEGR